MVQRMIGATALAAALIFGAAAGATAQQANPDAAKNPVRAKAMNPCAVKASDDTRKADAAGDGDMASRPPRSVSWGSYTPRSFVDYPTER